MHFRGTGHRQETPQGLGGVQVLEGWQIAANHRLGRVNDMLQSAIVLGSGSSILGGDEGDKDGFSEGGVEVHIITALCKMDFFSSYRNTVEDPEGHNFR